MCATAAFSILKNRYYAFLLISCDPILSIPSAWEVPIITVDRFVEVPLFIARAPYLRPFDPVEKLKRGILYTHISI